MRIPAAMKSASPKTFWNDHGSLETCSGLTIFAVHATPGRNYQQGYTRSQPYTKLTSLNELLRQIIDHLTMWVRVIVPALLWICHRHHFDLLLLEGLALAPVPRLPPFSLSQRHGLIARYPHDFLYRCHKNLSIPVFFVIPPSIDQLLPSPPFQRLVVRPRTFPHTFSISCRTR